MLHSQIHNAPPLPESRIGPALGLLGLVYCRHARLVPIKEGVARGLTHFLDAMKRRFTLFAAVGLEVGRRFEASRARFFHWPTSRAWSCRVRLTIDRGTVSRSSRRAGRPSAERSSGRASYGSVRGRCCLPPNSKFLLKPACALARCLSSRQKQKDQHSYIKTCATSGPLRNYHGA